MLKIIGWRAALDAEIRIAHGDGTLRQLPLRLDLRDHSPTGFEWGYVGSAPAQLALAMIAEATKSDDLAIATYHQFKEQVLAVIPRYDSWSMTYDEIHSIAVMLTSHVRVV